MTLELSMYLLGGCLFLLTILFGTVWKILRDEAKEHSRLIELKANTDRLSELDSRFDKELQNVRDSNEKLIEKIQLRHDRDLDTLSAGFKDQIAGIKEQMQSMERNILQQLAMMFGNTGNKQ